MPPVTPLNEDGPKLQPRRSSGAHPRVAVLLGVNAHWNIPLLICRATSTAPALWWGLRCALTFLGELLLSNEMDSKDGTWSVEKRFRVTEVFLAILWVCGGFERSEGHQADAGKCLASAYLSYFFTDCLMSRWQAFLPQILMVTR